jgi:formin-binding protein 1
LEKRAQEHERLSSELVAQVADPLRNLAAKYEELRLSHVDYAAKLEKEKDAALGRYP